MPDLVSSHFFAGVLVEDRGLPVQFTVHIVPLLHLATAALLHGLALQYPVLVYPGLHGAAAEEGRGTCYGVEYPLVPGVVVLGGAVQPPRHVAPLLLVTVVAAGEVVISHFIPLSVCWKLQLALKGKGR